MGAAQNVILGDTRPKLYHHNRLRVVIGNKQ